MSRRVYPQTILSLGVVLTLAQACAVLDSPKGGSELIVKECALPEDQAGSIIAKWKIKPIPIALHSGSQWDTGEIADITAAVDSWNTHFQAVIGAPVLDYGGNPENPRVSNTDRASNFEQGACTGKGLVQNDQFIAPVVIYKVGSWPYGHDVLALTNYCPPTPGTNPPFYSMAVMEVNYQDFFVTGKKVPHLQSIVTHELGHLLGLDHSCAGKTGIQGWISCSTRALSPDYLSAVMFPSFGFNGNAGEIRSKLNINDQGRANCLYPASAAN